MQSSEMRTRMRRRIVTRVLVVLIAGCVCYSLFVGFHALEDIETSNNNSAFVDYSRIQRPSSIVQLDKKHQVVSLKLPLDIQMSALRGQNALIDYCNSPSEKTSGSEGAQAEGYNLKLVHVFTRHGDRTPLHRVSGYEPETYNCNFSTWYTGSDANFRSFPQRMGRMSKTMNPMSFRNWPTFPNEDICKDSALTSRGALQHIRLGHHLYDSYINHFHLFKAHKSFSNQMDVKSTGTSRTFQSAVAFLYGFVSEFNISDFDIGYSQDLHFCSKEYTDQMTCNCQSTRALHVRSSWFQSTTSKNGSHHAILREIISEVFKIDDNDSRWLTRVADAFVPTYCHDLSIPCSSINSSKCIDHSLLGKLLDAITDKEFSHWEDPELNFLKYCSIKMAPVLLEVLQRMKGLIQGKYSKIFNLYSGHDLTVSALLYVLGLHDGRWPPYASRVVIETFEEENDDEVDRFYLRILYNGVDRTENVIFCKNRTVNGLCNFKYFDEFISNELLQRFGYSNYTDACTT